jgi:hypothetical protein
MVCAHHLDGEVDAFYAYRGWAIIDSLLRRRHR